MTPSSTPEEARPTQRTDEDLEWDRFGNPPEEGSREVHDCKCGAPYWTVFHGPQRNHTPMTPFAECCRQFLSDGTCCVMPDINDPVVSCDDAAIERGAQALAAIGRESYFDVPEWEAMSEHVRGLYLDRARVLVAAMAREDGT